MSAPGAEPLRVLMVEDEPADAQLIIRELRRAGFAPEWRRVETEDDFLEVAQPAALDLIIADYALPALNAPRTLELVRRLDIAAPVIVVTGTLADDEAVACIRLGAADYLLKDRLGRLGSAVRRALADRKSEEGRRRAETALRASEARFRALVEQSQEAILLLDRDGYVTYTSPAVEQLFGLRSADLLGRSALALVCADDVAEATRLFEQTLARDQAVATGTVRMQHQDGSMRWIEGSAENHFALTGVEAMVVHLRDATERRRAEEQRHELDRVEKLRAIGQLAGGLAHDVNQALGIVAGYSELALNTLARGEPDVVALRETLLTVHRAAIDGGETIRRLLTFSRRQEERPPQRVEVAALFHEVASLTAPHWRDAAQAEGHPIALLVEAQPGIAVDGWPSALREALTNLVLNAVDALPDGGRISLRCRQDGERCAIEVADSGAGMSPEVRARAFEPFFTTKGDAGTGLGLAQVFAIVERHRGQITLESEPGAGTTFRIVLPTATTVEYATTRAVAPAATPSLRVLIVDDEPRICRMAALMLTPHGHVTAVAESAAEALTRLEAEAFDLVLSDVGMGEGMNGWELAGEVRRRWPGTRVVLATGWGAAIDPEQAEAGGVERVVAKPYRSADLLAAVAGSG